MLSGGGWSIIGTQSSPTYYVTNAAPGDYFHRLSYTNTQCTGWPEPECTTYTLYSETIPVTVQELWTPPPPPPNPGEYSDPGASAQSDTLGTMAGNFRVDESGAATYHIPIAGPAGSAGVAPQISLNYSSSGGNGVAGMGWSIGGLSAITRCRQTFDQDKTVTSLTWTDSDRFCLDGHRLLVSPGQTYGADGSTYRTEIDSGVIVTVHGSVGSSPGEPDYFEVKRKDGSTSYYGKAPSNSDTSAKLTNGAGKTLTWSIRQFKDSVINSIWFEYTTGGGAQRISKIKYAYGTNSDPVSGYAARIEFEYETRFDKIAGYVAGYLFQNDQRLTHIKSYEGPGSGTLFRDYVLRYNEGITVTLDNISRLTSVQECVGSTCLPETTFGWRVPVDSPTISNIATTSLGSSFVAFTPIDMNGDGRTDLAWLLGSGSQKTLKFRWSSGSGFANGTFSNSSSSLAITTSASDPRITAIDYNLDGRQDVAYFDATANVWKIVLAEPDGYGGWRLNALPIATSIPVADVLFADADSNGTTDAIYKDTGPSGSNQFYIQRLVLDPTQANSSKRRYWFAAPVEIGAPGIETVGIVSGAAADFNGDGQVDVALGGQEYVCDEQTQVCDTVYNYRALTFVGFSGTSPTLSTYSHFPSESVLVGGVQQIHRPQLGNLQVVDINADGLSDVFYPLGPQSSGVPPSEYRLRINKGNGGFESIPITDAGITNADARPQFADWNMDGYPDLMWKDNNGSGSVKVRYWNPQYQDFGAVTQVTSAVSANAAEFVSYFDVNGDAVPDIVRMNAGGTMGSVVVKSRHSGGGLANRAVNRIESITNGIGATTQVTYEPLSYTDHYGRLGIGSTQGTQTVCAFLGDPANESCWEESLEVIDATAFYTAINGDWPLYSTAQSLGKNVPVIEMSGPMYVVTDVVGDAPAAGGSPGMVDVNATSAIEYHYREAKIQAAGRGFLGFKYLTTIDAQSQVKTVTRYRQDWPFIGSPMYTEVLTSAGHTLSQSSTNWGAVEWISSFPATATANGTAELGPLHIAPMNSGERAYELVSGGTGQGTALSTTSTSNSYDEEGNAKNIVITTKDGSGNTARTVTTVNQYYCLSGSGCINTGVFDLFEARLADTVVTTSVAGSAFNHVRHSTFDYHTGTHRGLLSQETIEPGTGFELQTSHSYDPFGNRIKSSVTDGIENRCNVNTVTFDSRGRYADTQFDCLGRLIRQVADRNTFGSPTQIRTYIDLNGTDFVETLIAYGAMGREYYRYTDDGSSAAKYLTPDLSDCQSGTAYKAFAWDATGAASQECFDVLGRSIRTMSKGFDGSWNAQDTEYDSFGRVRRKSEPFELVTASGTSSFWTTLDYDLLGRVTSTTLPDGSVASTEYLGLTIKSINDLNQDRKEVRNVLGEIVKVIDNNDGETEFAYVFNSAGQKISLVQ